MGGNRVNVSAVIPPHREGVGRMGVASFLHPQVYEPRSIWCHQTTGERHTWRHDQTRMDGGKASFTKRKDTRPVCRDSGSHAADVKRFFVVKGSIKEWWLF